MKILIISPLFPPSGSPQALQSQRLANALHESGMDVTVLAAGRGNVEPDNSHLDGEEISDDKRVKKITFNSPILIKLIAKLIPRMYRFIRPYDVFFHYTGLYNSLKKILMKDRYNAVISISEPLVTHRALQSCLSSSNKMKQVYWFSDPVPLIANKTLMRLSWRRKIIQKMVIKCLKKNNCIVGVTDEIINPIKQLSNENLKYMVLPHSFDEMDWPWPPILKELKSEQKKKIVILHSGALYWLRNPFTLLDGIEKFNSEKNGDFEFEVILQGVIEDKINKQIKSRVDKVFLNIEGSKNYLNSRKSMSNADILCVIDVDLPINIHLPSKIADYVGACKPILYIGNNNSPTCRYLSKIHPAFAQANDADSVSMALLDLSLKCNKVPIEDYKECYKFFSSKYVYMPLINHLVNE
jgi:hypothetical protein